MLITEEAGGICRTLEGEPMPVDGSKPTIVAGSREAVKEVLELAGAKWKS